MIDLPALGIVRDYVGQQYLLVGVHQYMRADESDALILTWLAACATCGAAFTFKGPGRTIKFQPSRRCQKHKRPGQRVGKLITRPFADLVREAL